MLSFWHYGYFANKKIILKINKLKNTPTTILIFLRIFCKFLLRNVIKMRIMKQSKLSQLAQFFIFNLNFLNGNLLIINNF